MKKIIISLILAVCMMFGLSACNNESSTGAGNKEENREENKDGNTKVTNKIKSVTIEGEKYDLSGDFQKVVGKMVKNGLLVVNINSFTEYDEDGKFLKKWNPTEADSSEIVIYVAEKPILQNLELGSIIVDIYELSRVLNCTFETADGITQDSDEDDLKELDGYVAYRGIKDPRAVSCIALYADGEIVDLEEYRDEYDAWLEIAEKEGIRSANEGEGLDPKYFPPLSRMEAFFSFESLETCKENMPYMEEEMLLTFAMQEACEKLEDKEIKSFDIVHYSCESNGMIVEFYHYYRDKNWNQNKFRREN